MTMSKRVNVTLTEAELEALKGVLRHSIKGPDTPDAIGAAYDKVIAALWAIEEGRHE